MGRKFGEEENLKNRQFSRSARNSGGKAVAPLSNVLLFVFLIVIVAPVLFMMWFSISNNSNQVKPRTADDVMLTKTVETTTATPETTAATTKKRLQLQLTKQQQLHLVKLKQLNKHLQLKRNKMVTMVHTLLKLEILYIVSQLTMVWT